MVKNKLSKRQRNKLKQEGVPFIFICLNPVCNHIWEARVEHPAVCPGCRRRKYRPLSQLEILQYEKGKRGVELEQTLKYQPEKAKEEYKAVSGRRWWLVFAGVIIIIIGMLMAVMWTGSRNMIFVLLFIALTPAGVYLSYLGLKPVEPGVARAKKASKSPVNSLNIYPNKVAFEWVDNPVGQPQQCLNDNKFYFVNIYDDKENGLVPFVLPDEQYYDPHEFANVIKMPAWRRLIRKRPTLFQKISPFILLAAIAIICFMLLTTGD